GDGQSEDDDEMSDDETPADVTVSIDDLRHEFDEPDACCWGCMCDFGPQRQPGKDKDYDNLWSEFIRYRGSKNQNELAKYLAQVHEETIYTPLINSGQECLFWPAAMIIKHINHHMKDVRTIVE